jgi:hypothetical protein
MDKEPTNKENESQYAEWPSDNDQEEDKYDASEALNAADDIIMQSNTSRDHFVVYQVEEIQKR